MHSPELQPAEHLWEFVDEPLAKEIFDRLAELEAALAERCVALTEQPERILDLTLYHWWAGSIRPQLINRIWYQMLFEARALLRTGTPRL